MKTILVAALTCCSIAAWTQNKQPKAVKPEFFSTNQAMHIEGSHGGAFGAETVNGVRIGGWNAGVGIGLDKYRMRSAPLFFHLRRQMPFMKAPLYLYASAGNNIIWPEKGMENFNPGLSRNNGSFWDGGLQYHLRFKNGGALVFSAGYSQKTYSEEITITPWCNFGPCPQQKNLWEYRLRRILLKAGFEL